MHHPSGRTRIVTVARDVRFRDRVRAGLAAHSDVLVAGEAVDAVGAMVVCALAHPMLVVVDAALSREETHAIANQVGRVSPATRLVSWSFQARDDEPRGAPSAGSSGRASTC